MAECLYVLHGGGATVYKQCVRSGIYEVSKPVNYNMTDTKRQQNKETKTGHNISLFTITSTLLQKFSRCFGVIQEKRHNVVLLRLPDQQGSTSNKQKRKKIKLRKFRVSAK